MFKIQSKQDQKAQVRHATKDKVAHLTGQVAKLLKSRATNFHRQRRHVAWQQLIIFRAEVVVRSAKTDWQE